LLYVKYAQLPSDHTCSRLTLLEAGLPRTGTASLKLALEHLGIGPCHHLADPPNQYDRLRLTADLLNTRDTQIRRQKLAELFDGCEAILEQPVCACLPDLLRMYPEAKVILTERSSARLWLESWQGSISYTRHWSWRYAGYLMPAAVSTNDIYRAWTRISALRFGIQDDVTEELYHAHSAWVKSHVAPENLLLYRVEMGYAPLCKFLGREMPEGKMFPRSHRSDRETFQLYKWLCMTCGAIAWFGVAALAWFACGVVLDSWIRLAGHIVVVSVP
jgi:hypothetical protein